jgi:hypothetical protein
MRVGSVLKMITTYDFNKPDKHPYGMLSGYDRASEKESVLSWMLDKSIEGQEFGVIQCTHEHPSMVRDGFLKDEGDRRYSLTQKSIELLYSVYGNYQ